MQGQLEISSTLAREAGVDELAEQREPFLEVPVVIIKTIIVVVLEPCHGPKNQHHGLGMAVMMKMR